MVKGRLRQLSLLLPQLALGGDQALAKDQLERVIAGALTKALVRVLQHVLHIRWVIEQQVAVGAKAVTNHALPRGHASHEELDRI